MEDIIIIDIYQITQNAMQKQLLPHLWGVRSYDNMAQIHLKYDRYFDNIDLHKPMQQFIIFTIQWVSEFTKS